jgi:hypothetical protein
MQYPPLRAGRLLFVGLNPSYSEQARGAGDDPDLHEPADLEDADLVRTRIEWEIHWRQGDPPYPYFRPFYEVGVPWEHIDLFAVRERDQGKVRKTLALKEDARWTEFAEAQFAIFEELIASLRPGAIIVVSALGASLLAAKWSSTLTPVDCEANRMWRCNDRTVPIFLAGMLSGARAMDRFSRYRLLRDVQTVFGKPPART